MPVCVRAFVWLLVLACAYLWLGRCVLVRACVCVPVAGSMVRLCVCLFARMCTPVASSMVHLCVCLRVLVRAYVRTCGRVDGALDQVVVLVNPFAVALEVDLRGGRGAAGQRHRLVLHDVLILGLHQEVR